MRLAFAWFVLLLTAFPAIADDDDDERFNTAYRAFEAALESGDIELAITSAKTALDIASSIPDVVDRELAILKFNYGNVLVRGGRLKEGRKVIKQSIGEMIESSGEHDPGLANFYAGMANAFPGPEGEDDKLYWYTRALSVKASTDGEDSIGYANLAFDAAISLYESSGSVSGEKLLAESLPIFEKEYGPTSPPVGGVKYQLARFAFTRGEYRVSAEYLLDALRSFDADSEDFTAPRSMIHALLVQNYELLGESDNATVHCIAVGREIQFAPDRKYVPLYRVAPEYPEIPLRNGVEGHVVLSFTIDESGFVRNPEVVEGVVNLGNGDFQSMQAGLLDEAQNRSFEVAALAAVKQYRFAPKFLDGVPVPVDGVKSRITFKIAEN